MAGAKARNYNPGEARHQVTFAEALPTFASNIYKIVHPEAYEL